MLNITIKYKPYSLLLKNAFTTAKGEIKERKGFLITIKDERGNKGTGDCAPFPEFGSESYDEAFETIENFNGKLFIDDKNIYKTIRYSLKQFDNLPALKHGLEQALVNYYCSKNNVSLNEALNVKSNKTVNINAAIGFLSPEQTKQKAKQLIAAGFKTIKLKSGRADFNKDLECIAAVRNLSEEIKIRIDVNGKWSLEEAQRHFKELGKFNIEYVEQPVSNIKYFAALKRITTIQLAADESVRTFTEAIDIITNKYADVLILKPMLLGGIVPLLSICEAALKNKIKCVVSSSFESVVGHSYALFAASTIKGKTAHGLGVSDYFENNLFPNPYPVVNGQIKLG
ncbi:MAG: o-succinylbenzoate synthase [Ignavibacteriaceae bacterium]|nr:o-succinylbenzoate synthase [Ignavibacteriaceae bacterium]